MSSIQILEATRGQVSEVASLVQELLIELEPEIKESIAELNLLETTRQLFDANKIIAFLAIDSTKPVGILTLHECAAIYAGGLFGEISELYVKPAYRSKHVGQMLIDNAITKAQALNWKRLEVGSPPAHLWPRTVNFYETNNFAATGTRLRRLIS